MLETGHRRQDAILIQLLGCVPLFAAMSRDQLVELLSCAEKIVFREDEHVFYEGETGNSVYILISGTVAVEKSAEDGKRATLAELKPGASFGEMALIDRSVRSASVRALKDSVTLKLRQECLDRFPRSASLLYRNIARTLVQRVRQTNDLVLFHSFALKEEIPQPSVPRVRLSG